ncbi:hypothetical protein ABPG75_013376 [Micractinium tetrahymenae]
MMNPEMMRMASEMMSRMTPEQMAAMQQQMASMPPEMMQQAMQMAQNATPEQIAQMRAAASTMPPEVMAAQASQAAGMYAGQGAGQQQQRQQLEAAAQLKAEGNRLHGAKAWREAAEKYERALSSLTGHSSRESRDLRTSCQSNLASCALQLGQWERCAELCGTVLAADANNRKALYRRGQALCALGRYEAAVADLRQAVRLSPESEKDVIRDKLAEAKQKMRQEAQGVRIEEVTEPAAADEPASATPTAAAAPAAAAAAASQQQEGLVEEADETNEDMPELEEPAGTAGTACAAGSASAAGTAAAAAAAPPPPFLPPGMDAAQAQKAQEMLRSNPDMARQAATMMSAMSDEQLASMLAQSGVPGITPAMAKQAADMMRSMPPDQLAAMAQAQAGFPGGMPASTTVGSSGQAAVPAAAAAPAPPAVPAGPAAGGSQEEQMRAAAEAMKQNPEMMKSAASMLENMSEEQLRAMAAAMPGAAGMQVDPAQMKMAAKMMAAMSPEDLEGMQRMAASMQGMPGMPSMPAGAAAGGSGGAAAAPAGAAGVLPAGFDPAAGMPPGMMADMRKQMQDPKMLKMMKNMLKGMDPEALASMMQGSGLSVTPDQARTMVDKLDAVSDKHLELIARLLRWFNAVVAAYQRAKAWVMSQGALTLAALVLVVAVLLRLLGWI